MTLHYDPRLKFQKPLACGVFFCGHAPESSLEQFLPEHQPPAPPPGPRAPGPQQAPDRQLVRSLEGITFAVDSSFVPPEVCHAVSRMHVTLGHPTNSDLVRLLSHQGASLPAITAARALRCEFCLRHRAPRQQPPAATPISGQFNDRFQMDIFFIHDLSHRQYLVLGVVDVVTSYHVARRIENRDSHQVPRAFT